MSSEAESGEALIAKGPARKCRLPPSTPQPAGRDRVGEEGPGREPSPRACLPAGMGWSQGPRQRISDFHRRTGEVGSHSKASHSHWRDATASVLRGRLQRSP